MGIDNLHNSGAPSNYELLHALPILRESKSKPLPLASALSTLRTFFQSIEIGLLNVADLLRGAARNLADDDASRGAAKLRWVRGFHHLIGQLCFSPCLFRGSNQIEPANPWNPYDSPGVAGFLAAQQEFDDTFTRWLAKGRSEKAAVFSSASLEDSIASLFHWVRICNHEATIWEGALSSCLIPDEVAPYVEFIGATALKEAVAGDYERQDDFLTVFRGLHQIPETLAAEANDHLEQIIREVRSGKWEQAAVRFQMVNDMVARMIDAAVLMVDNLPMADYHTVRDRLRQQSSGIHSVAIHYHLFGDLYEQLVAEVCRLNETDENCPGNGQRNLMELTLQFRMSIMRWRGIHFHWPRNHLGSMGTRSLIGSDAMAVTNRLRSGLPLDADFARAAHRFGIAWPVNVGGPIAARLAVPDSLDSRLLTLTGEIARNRYPEVQSRTGPYGRPDTFRPPARRVV